MHVLVITVGSLAFRLNKSSNFSMQIDIWLILHLIIVLWANFIIFIIFSAIFIKFFALLYIWFPLIAARLSWIVSVYERRSTPAFLVVNYPTILWYRPIFMLIYGWICRFFLVFIKFMGFDHILAHFQIHHLDWCHIFLMVVIMSNFLYFSDPTFPSNPFLSLFTCRILHLTKRLLFVFLRYLQLRKKTQQSFL